MSYNRNYTPYFVHSKESDLNPAESRSRFNGRRRGAFRPKGVRTTQSNVLQKLLWNEEQNKILQRKINKAKREIQRFKEMNYEEMSDKEKQQYQEAKHALETLPAKALGGRAKDKPPAKTHWRQPIEIQTERRTGWDTRRGNTPERVTTSSNAQGKRRDDEPGTSRAILTKESSDFQESLPREYHNQLMRKIEKAREAVRLDYERGELSIADRDRLDKSYTDMAARATRDLQRDFERDPSRHRPAKQAGRFDYERGGQGIADRDQFEEPYNAMPARGNRDFHREYERDPSKRRPASDERRFKWEMPRSNTPERETARINRSPVVSNEREQPYFAPDKGSENGQEESNFNAMAEEIEDDQVDNSEYLLKARKRNIKRIIRRYAKMDYQSLSMAERKQYGLLKKLHCALCSPPKKEKQNGPPIVKPAANTKWNKKQEDPKKYKWESPHNKNTQMVVTSTNNAATISRPATMVGKPETMTTSSVANYTASPKDQVPVAGKMKSIQNAVIDGNDHLQVAVVDGFGPGRKLGEEEWAHIERNILFNMDEMLLRSFGPYPIFNQMTNIKGYKILSCGNEFTLKWLKTTVNEMIPPWRGARLNLVAKKNLVTGPLVRISLPEPSIRKNRLQQFIRNLNPEFPTHDWRVIKIEDNSRGNGQEAIVMLNDESMSLLRGKDFKIRIGINVVTAWPIDDTNERPAGGWQ